MKMGKRQIASRLKPNHEAIRKLSGSIHGLPKNLSTRKGFSTSADTRQKGHR
ncbi:MAG: hypothetical protein QOJ40_1030 [Verrucomicrobiota bacterium]